MKREQESLNSTVCVHFKFLLLSFKYIYFFTLLSKPSEPSYIIITKASLQKQTASHLSVYVNFVMDSTSQVPYCTTVVKYYQLFSPQNICTHK